MSSAGIQKLFCGIYSAFKCSFDEFVGEKVFSLSYSSAILAPPSRCFLTSYFCIPVPYNEKDDVQKVNKHVKSKSEMGKESVKKIKAGGGAKMTEE